MDGSYEVRDLWIERPGGRIYGQLFVPSGTDEKRPAVICSHYFGGSARDSAEWARLIAKAGYSAYAFDYCGATTMSHSEGVGTLEMSIKTEEIDLSCVLDAIRSLPDIDGSYVFLLGQSQGGLISSMVAEDRPTDVAGLFLLYPGFGIQAQMRGRFGSADNVPETFKMWQPLGKVYAIDAMEYDPFEHMHYDGPVYIWHGKEDPIVPLAYSERAVNTYPHASLKVVRSSEHHFGSDDQKHIASEIAEHIAGTVEKTSVR